MSSLTYQQSLQKQLQYLPDGFLGNLDRFVEDLLVQVVKLLVKFVSLGLLLVSDLLLLRSSQSTLLDGSIRLGIVSPQISQKLSYLFLLSGQNCLGVVGQIVGSLLTKVENGSDIHAIGASGK